MTSRIAAAIAAGFLAIGILVGAAGAVLVRELATPDYVDHMGGASAMVAMMGGGSMMGANGWSRHHAAHHAWPTVESTR